MTGNISDKLKTTEQARLGLIGGTGLLNATQLGADDDSRPAVITTPFGDPSSGLQQFELGGMQVHFLARHGRPHRIPPHRVNYRANLWALHSDGVSRVLAVNAVGSTREDLPAGSLVVPDQLIDYTWGRDHTYSDSAEVPLQHVEFAEPYAGPLRQSLLQAADAAGVHVVKRGCYAATQGPRLETAAEVQRLRNDGADLIGMTGMPEAGLARELGMDYASLSIVANLGAGIGDPISIEEINSNLETGLKQVAQLLEQLCEQLAAS